MKRSGKPGKSKRPGRGRIDWKKNQGQIMTVTLLAAVLVFVGSSVWMNIRLVEIGNRMSYLQDTVDVVQTDVGSLQSDLERTLREENSFLESCSIEVAEVDLTEGTYRVEIDAIPKEYTDNTELSIYFGTKVFSLKKDDFHYTGTAELPLSEAYDGNVTLLITNGKKKNTEILQDYEGYPTLIQRTLTGTLGAEPVYQDGRLTADGEVEYHLSGQEVPGVEQFESLYLVVTVGEEVYYRKQLITEEVLADNPGVLVASLVTESSDGGNAFEWLIPGFTGRNRTDDSPQAAADGSTAAGTKSLRNTVGGTLQATGEAVEVGEDTTGRSSSGPSSDAVSAQNGGASTGVQEGGGVVPVDTQEEGGASPASERRGGASPVGGANSGAADDARSGASEDALGKTEDSDKIGQGTEDGQARVPQEPDPSAGIVTGLAGTVSLELREAIQERLRVHISLQAVSTEEYTCEYVLFSGMVMPGTDEGIKREEEFSVFSITDRDGRRFEF